MDDSTTFIAVPFSRTSLHVIAGLLMAVDVMLGSRRKVCVSHGGAILTQSRLLLTDFLLLFHCFTVAVLLSNLLFRLLVRFSTVS